MNPTETLPSRELLPPAGLAVDLGAEHLRGTDLTTANALGHAALGGEVDLSYVENGIVQAEAHANGEPVADTRVHDIEAAHEEALRQNALFDLQTQALQENAIFDAHVAALQENEEREAATATQAAVTERKQEQEAELSVVQSMQQPAASEITSNIAAGSPEEIRQEAAALLKEAGVSTRLPANSEVSRDVMGNVCIVSDTEARVITRSAGGAPRVTEYHYDRDDGTLTVDDHPFRSLTGAFTKYEESMLKDWQTQGDVIELPHEVAKRFGVERVIAVH